MSEIQIFGDANFSQWVVTGLVGLVVGLIGVLWRSLKKDVDKIKERQDLDHDRIEILETKHKMRHPED